MWCCNKCREIFKIDHEQNEALAKSMRDKLREANKALKAERDARRALKREAMEIVFE
jgi:hypothetical protein